MSLSSDQKKHLPMVVTYSRILLTPLIMYVLMDDHSYSAWIASGIFVVASWTDWLDGFLARLFKVESNMGRFMDPIADKILILGCLLVVLDMNRVGPWPVALLLARDIYIGGLRSVAAANQIIISARPLGKWKTALQMLCMPCLFLENSISDYPLLAVGQWALWGAVALSWLSGIEYIYGYQKGQK